MSKRPNRAQQVLIEARKLLGSPYGWTKKQSARRIRVPHGGFTIAYCARGAVFAAATRLSSRTDTRVRALNAVSSSIDGLNVIRWNDAPGRKKREVLAAFDDAIKRAGS